jgi:hypothetical protein
VLSVPVSCHCQVSMRLGVHLAVVVPDEEDADEAAEDDVEEAEDEAVDALADDTEEDDFEDEEDVDVDAFEELAAEEALVLLEPVFCAVLELLLSPPPPPPQAVIRLAVMPARAKYLIVMLKGISVGEISRFRPLWLEANIVAGLTFAMRRRR